MIRVRASKEVVQTSAGTRRRTFTVRGKRHTLDFGKEPHYLPLDEIPAELAQDPHLLTKVVTEEEMLAAGGTLFLLEGGGAPLPGEGRAMGEGSGVRSEELDLKSERVQEPAAAAAPEPAINVAPQVSPSPGAGGLGRTGRGGRGVRA
jgi:hypothetical protein